VHYRAQVETYGKTGVEIQTLTAVQAGPLTVYDICKAVDRGMVMTDIHVRKSTGQERDWSV
jgi:cyclic pyranopterin monophosphate synthase